MGQGLRHRPRGRLGQEAVLVSAGARRGTTLWPPLCKWRPRAQGQGVAGSETCFLQQQEMLRPLGVPPVYRSGMRMLRVEGAPLGWLHP